MSQRLDRAANLTVLVILLATVAATGVAALEREQPEPEQSVTVGVQGIDDHGQLATVAPNQSLTWHRADADSYHSVERINETHTLASFAVYTGDGGETGFRIINRSSGEIDREWTFNVDTVPNSEVHDSELLPSGEIVVADMDRERIMTVAQNGTITWQWNAGDHYQPPGDPRSTDWLHINDVDRIGEGRFLVSVRNAHQLVIVERGDGIVDVINQGQDTAVLNSQHNPQWLGDGRVLVADSENDRVVELQRRNGSWKPVWAVDSAGGMQFNWPRDADRLPNGNTLITDSRNHRVLLVDENGTLVGEWATPKLPYEADLGGGSETVGGPHLADDTVPTVEDSGVVAAFELPLVAAHHTIGAPAWLRWWHFASLGLCVVVRATGDIATTQSTTTQIRCGQCGSDGAESTHKGDTTQECPQCGDILFREINND